jgi:hypothetical protein
MKPGSNSGRQGINASGNSPIEKGELAYCKHAYYPHSYGGPIWWTETKPASVPSDQPAYPAAVFPAGSGGPGGAERRNYPAGDDFKLMMIVALGAIPFIFLLRRAWPHGGAVEAVLELYRIDGGIILVRPISHRRRR